MKKIMVFVLGLFVFAQLGQALEEDVYIVEIEGTLENYEVGTQRLGGFVAMFYEGVEYVNVIAGGDKAHWGASFPKDEVSSPMDPEGFSTFGQTPKGQCGSCYGYDCHPIEIKPDHWLIKVHLSRENCPPNGPWEGESYGDDGGDDDPDDPPGVGGSGPGISGPGF